MVNNNIKHLNLKLIPHNQAKAFSWHFSHQPNIVLSVLKTIVASALFFNISLALAQGPPDNPGQGPGNGGSQTGPPAQTQPVFLHFDGGSWRNETNVSNSYNAGVNAVECISSSDCWAVGNKNNRSLHWDGNSWGETNSANYNNELYEVVCTASNNCWAVGNKSNTVNHYTGGNTWNQPSTPYGQALRGVTCRNSNECWAVGDKSQSALKWNGSSWVEQTTPFNPTLRAIDHLPKSGQQLEFIGWKEEVK